MKFDGYRKGVLLEAKGPGYAKFVENGGFKQFFAGRGKLLEQANRQRRAAKGAPVEWHIAEKEFARALENFFATNRVSGIRIVHTP